jgi:hypothetical protein
MRHIEYRIMNGGIRSINPQIPFVPITKRRKNQGRSQKSLEEIEDTTKSLRLDTVI